MRRPDSEAPEAPEAFPNRPTLSTFTEKKGGLYIENASGASEVRNFLNGINVRT
jgi:hypothetical protein